MNAIIRPDGRIKIGSYELHEQCLIIMKYTCMIPFLDRLAQKGVEIIAGGHEINIYDDPLSGQAIAQKRVGCVTGTIDD